MCENERLYFDHLIDIFKNRYPWYAESYPFHISVLFRLNSVIRSLADRIIWQMYD